GGGARVRPARSGGADHQRPVTDARGRERDAEERRRAGVRHPAGAFRGGAAALPVTKKNPTRGGTPPRVGGRAKWPSHFGRDLIMAHPLYDDGTRRFHVPVPPIRRIAPRFGCTPPPPPPTPYPHPSPRTP